ncbi:MAG: hypothetical protein WAV55_02375 [Clostridiaceae bacterium]
MRTVAVEITEILQRKVFVQIPESANVYDAVSFIETQYGEDKLALDYRDFVDVSFGIAN